MAENWRNWYSARRLGVARRVGIALLVMAAVGATLVVTPRSVAAANEPDVQAGTILITQARTRDWKRVRFADRFDVPPVVVLGGLSLADTTPAITRIRNVTTTGFDLRVDEWDNADDVHGQESVSYLAMEPGKRRLGALQLEARTARTNHRWDRRTFTAGFNDPVVLAHVQSFSDDRSVTVRLRDVRASGVGFRLQEQEANSPHHAQERVGFIAIEMGSTTIDGERFVAGRTGASVGGTELAALGFAVSPDETVVAGAQTTTGYDPAALRQVVDAGGAVTVRMDEETSADAETDHAGERVGWVIVPKTLSTSRTEGDVIDVFIVAGQSNAAHRIPGYSPREMDGDVRYYYHSRGRTDLDGWTALGPNRRGLWNVDLPLGRAVGSRVDDAAIINVSVNWTSLADHWNSENEGSAWELWRREVATALSGLEALGKPIRVAGFFWMQGERDATTRDEARAYRANFTNLMNNVTEHIELLGHDTSRMAWVSGGVVGKRHADRVNQAQIGALASRDRAAWVDTSAYRRHADGIHLDATGVQALGANFALYYHAFTPQD